jgi:hypothetical protein
MEGQQPDQQTGPGEAEHDRQQRDERLGQPNDCVLDP